MKNDEKTLLFQNLALHSCDQKILDVMYKVPREKFISASNKDNAYKNTPLSINCMQTISQPYIIAKMTELLLNNIHAKKILEIGTGSGYQAAILSLLVEEVYTLERFEKLHLKAKQSLTDYPNVHCYHQDGFRGLANHAPYDGIIITASVDKIPKQLIEQMSKQSIIVYPEKTKSHEKLATLYKKNDVFTKVYYESVRFVPMLPNLE